MMLCRHRENKIWSLNDTVAADVTEPVTLDEAKGQLTIDFNDDDAYITELIKQCRDGIERYCNISMVIKTWTLYADIYEEMELPMGPIASVTSDMYRNGSTYEATTEYVLDGDAGSFMLYTPGIGGRHKIIYVAGPYVKKSLNLDLLRVIAYCYENRGDSPLTSLQNGTARPDGLDQAMELFAGKYRRFAWL